MLQDDLVEADEARVLLKMPQAKFELLVETGQLKIFRSNGKPCFRREDISSYARKRQAMAVATKSPALKRPVTVASAAPSMLKASPAKSAVQVASAPPSAVRVAPAQPAAEADAEVELEEEPIEPTSSQRRTPRWLIGISAATLLGIVALTFTLLRAHAEPPQSAKLTDATLPHRNVAAPGLVEPASGVRNLSFDIPGRIKTVNVEEDQSVKAGQLIAELENDDAAARLDSARADVASAEAKVEITERNLSSNVLRAQSDVERIGAELALLVAGPRKEQIAAAKADAAAAAAAASAASEDEARYLDPTDKYESWPRQRYDQAHRQAEVTAAKLAAATAQLQQLQAGSRKEDLDRARATLGAAQVELSRLEKTRPYELNAVRAQLSQARAQAANAEAMLKKTRVYSPIDGKVVWKFLHGGETIDAIQRQPVATVADTKLLRVRASVDEADYPYVHAGQAVRIKADAFDGKYFAGRVEYIGSSAGEKPFYTGEARERMDVRVIQVLITLNDATPLKLALRVTVLFDEL
jgi:multidrug resistance efflux pump